MEPPLSAPRTPRRANLTPRQPVGAVQVTTKPGVDVDLHPAMGRALKLIEQQGWVVTSGAEGAAGDRVHAGNSLHYDRLAVDVRKVKDWRAQTAAFRQLGYKVLDNYPTHMHVSFDPEGRRV